MPISRRFWPMATTLWGQRSRSWRGSWALMSVSSTLLPAPPGRMPCSWPSWPTMLAPAMRSLPRPSPLSPRPRSSASWGPRRSLWTSIPKPTTSTRPSWNQPSTPSKRTILLSTLYPTQSLEHRTLDSRPKVSSPSISSACAPITTP